jgi:hypothetical protein
MQRCNILDPSIDWFDFLEEGCNRWKTKSMLGVLCRLVLSAAVYGIWRGRNDISFGGQPSTEEQILKLIFWEVRFRVSGKGKFKKNLENVQLCLNWNIDVNILV